MTKRNAGSSRKRKPRGPIGERADLAVAKDGTHRGVEAHRSAPKLTGELLEAFLEKVRKGTPWTTAARLVKVWPSSVDEKARKDPAFNETLQQARAEAEETLRIELHEAALDGKRTQGLQFLAERLHPATFAAPPKDVRHHGHEGGPVESVVRVSVEQARAGARGEPPK